MTDDHAEIGLPVRSLEIVSSDGGHRRHLRVFCPVESASMDPRTCAQCDLCISFPKDLEADLAELRCQSRRRAEPSHAASWFVGTDAVSTWLPAGAVASRRWLCVSFDASIWIASDALVRNAVGAAVVVDERTRPLGVVGNEELRARQGMPVLAVVDAAVPQIEESAPLAEVIARMVYGRARRVVLVRSDGSAAGLVTEIDVLHWIALGGSQW